MGTRHDKSSLGLSWLLALATVTVCCTISPQVTAQPTSMRQRPAISESRGQEDLSQSQRRQTQQAASNNKSRYSRLFSDIQAVARNSVAAANQNQNHITNADDYTCAPFCQCSMVPVTDRTLATSSGSRLTTADRPSNLSRVFCESSHFTDLLTIDRRTQIIHISLPANHSGRTNERPLIASGQADEQQQTFRMPRLAQFTRLREIIIIKLRFEVCDSEVFKRGQVLLRLRLNHNHLRRISRSCLKYLDKLLELNLDHNNLSELESALFSGLTSLRSLSIAHNRLGELAAHQFVNLSRLMTLNLVGNSFKTINLHLLEPMQASLRYLLLAGNQIKSFAHSPPPPTPQLSSSRLPASGMTTSSLVVDQLIRVSQPQPQQQQQSSSVGLVFRNLIKLNVDQNKFERIKLLQLHRFYNVKFLSIRHNEIASIRDKAFNGLKLVELNLAHNQLQSISKCAFCNSTIKRLVLSNNNISLPQPSLLQLEPAPAPAPAPLPPSSLPLSSSSGEPSSPEPSASPLMAHLSAATSSQNMLILSQSIFGPLFGQLEYLDLSNNEQLANQLEFLLEPLLKLEYLNLASVGLDRSLPTPSLFKNLRQLRYLNLSHNQLDQLVAETVEPLAQLEVLDLSHNKFSELDEYFLVTIDEISPLKLLNLGSNPWYCSQCKVAPLYDWILRSPIYNLTCVSPLMRLREQQDTDESAPDPNQANHEMMSNSDDADHESIESTNTNLMIPLANSYALLDDVDLMNDGGQSLTNSNYNLLSPAAELSRDESLMRELTPASWMLDTSKDDKLIEQTMALVATINHNSNLKSLNMFDPGEFCLRCEFPSELSAFHIHELAPGDFKFCAGAAPRFSASEPKIGLTLALVIIGALFCIIIVVIVMYRKKSNTYYTNEDMDQLDGSRQTSSKRPVFSISSDNENNQYGDGTDYSSPPVSHSMDSYSQEDEDEDEEDEEDDEDEEEDLDEDEEGRDGEEGQEDEDEDEDEEDEVEDGDEDEDVSGSLADEDEEEEEAQRKAAEMGQVNREPTRDQRQNTGDESADSHQSRQTNERTKRNRRNQLDEITNETPETRGHLQESEPEAASALPAAGESIGLANPAARRTDSSSAGASRQIAVARSVARNHRHHQSSVAAEVNSSGSVDRRQANLIRNQSHPQQQEQQQQQQLRLTFADETSIPGDSRIVKALRKGRSKEAGEAVRQTSVDSNKGGPALPVASQLEDKIVSRVQQFCDSNRELSAQQPRKQHSLVKQTTGKRISRDQQSGPQIESKSRSTLRRHHTSKEQTSSHSNLVQVPSQRQQQQQQSNVGPKLVQLQVRALPASDNYAMASTAQVEPSRPISDLARQRFAISKEISQTFGDGAGGSARQAFKTSAGRQVSKPDGELLRPSQGRAGEQVARGSERAGRHQMGHWKDHDESGTSNDATTADSLALEPTNAVSGSIDELLELELELEEPTAETMGYSGGGALAPNSDSDEASSLDEPAPRASKPSRLRPAVSSHSALTQTGSGDLLD